MLYTSELFNMSLSWVHDSLVLSLNIKSMLKYGFEILKVKLISPTVYVGITL